MAPVDGLARCGLHVSPVQINGENPHMHFQINTAFVDLSNMPSIFLLCKLLFRPRIFLGRKYINPVDNFLCPSLRKPEKFGVTKEYGTC